MPTHSCAACPLAGSTPVTISGPAQPDVVLVCGFPTMSDARAKTPFSTGRGALLRRLMADLTRRLPINKQPGVAYACAARCPPRDGADRAAAVECCGPRLLAYLDRAAPRVVVALGNAALTALGIAGRVTELRGSIPQLRLGLNRQVPVIITHHILEADASPGLLTTVRADLGKALRLALGDAAAALPMPETVLTVADIIDALERAGESARLRAAADGKPVALTLHAVTLGRPSSPEGRLLAFGLCPATGASLAFPFDHPAHPFGDADFSAVRQGLERLLSSAAVRLAAWDGKTLGQWLRCRYGLGVPDCGYDARLAEHALEEGKGGYGFTEILLDRFPSLCRREAERQSLLEAAMTRLERRRRDALKSHADHVQLAMREWWLDISPDARLKCLAAWVEKGFLRLSEADCLRAARRVNRKGKWVVPQRHQAALELLSRVPPEAAPGLRPPAPPDPAGEGAPEANLPLDALLRDAGLKAAALRLLIADQLERFAEDDARVADAARRMGRRIATVPALRAVHFISMPLSSCLGHMEYHGVRFHRERAAACAAALEERRAAARERLFREAGHAFNPGAGPDLARVLYDEMGLPVFARTVAGIPATDGKTLAGLNAACKLPFLEDLIVLRKLDAAARTLESWLAESAADGRIHAIFDPAGTATFRVTCSRPNVQGIPARLAGLNLKALFLPDSENHELYTADIAQADLRALAAYSRDAALINCLREGRDPHAMSAAELTRHSYEEITARGHEPGSEAYQARRIGKRVNFGVVNGMTAAGLQRQLWNELRLDVSEATCRAWLDAWFAAHPRVAAYIRDTTSFVRRFQFVPTFTSRRRHFPLAAYTAPQCAARARQAVNARLQITTADLVSLNCIDLHNALLPTGGRLLLTVHDSMVFQLPKDADNVRSLLDRLIVANTARRAPWLPVPWAYEARRGPSYGETVALAY